MNRTGIEYLTHSWSPIAMRCTPVSAGCTNCWHLRMADRLKENKNLSFDVRRAYAGEGPPVLVEERLVKPLRRKKPARIGTQFMGDLFNDDVPESFIFRVFRITREVSQHRFLILTKRPGRMLAFMHEYYARLRAGYGSRAEEPQRNVWLGVSVENQAAADKRIPLLLQTPAAVRFVSLEPLLGAVDLLPWLRPYPNCGNVAEDGTCASLLNPTPECHIASCPMTDVHQGISWVICGGESGPSARPTHPDWVREIRDQCVAANVPFFFKSWGAWFPRSQWEDNPDLILPDDYNCTESRNLKIIDDDILHRVGKKHAGYLLDGKEWREFPD